MFAVAYLNDLAHPFLQENLSPPFLQEDPPFQVYPGPPYHLKHNEKISQFKVQGTHSELLKDEQL